LRRSYIYCAYIFSLSIILKYNFFLIYCIMYFNEKSFNSNYIRIFLLYIVALLKICK
ncbi:hypothetical protein L9F63_022287, partial [Diploptera punctata]